MFILTKKSNSKPLEVETFEFKRFKNKILLFNHIFLRVWRLNHELLLYFYKRFL